MIPLQDISNAVFEITGYEPSDPSARQYGKNKMAYYSRIIFVYEALKEYPYMVVQEELSVKPDCVIKDRQRYKKLYQNNNYFRFYSDRVRQLLTTNKQAQ